jgi:hypothetical protein
MTIKLDLKTLLTLGGIIAMLGGFVYTTKLRLDLADQRIDKIENDCSRLQRKLGRPKKSKEIK